MSWNPIVFTLNFVLLFSKLLWLCCLLHFHKNFRNTLLISTKFSIWVLIGIALNLYSNLGTTDILTILRLQPTNEICLSIYLGLLQLLYYPCRWQTRKPIIIIGLWAHTGEAPKFCLQYQRSFWREGNLSSDSYGKYVNIR